MLDSLIECPLCSAPYCYQAIHQGMVNWKCLSCGYVTNSNMMLNTELVKAHESTLPKLYVDIKQVDKSKLVWYPQVIDLVEKGAGIVFANGTNHQDWKWTFAPAALIQTEEMDKFRKKDGSCPKYKTDMTKAKHFEKTEFSLAINELGIF